MVNNVYIALGYFIRLLDLAIFVRCILSWLPMGFNNPVTRLVYNLTEPLLAPVRNMLYKSPLGGPGMMLDFSPILVWLILDGIYSVLGQALVAFL